MLFKLKKVKTVTVLAISVMIFGSSHVFSQNLSNDTFQWSGGLSLIVYQSIYSLQSSPSFELAVEHVIRHQMNWAAGVRLGSGPPHPELFGRLLFAPQKAGWRAKVGLELGVTSRIQFHEGAKLLRETRHAMKNDISPVYIAAYAAPLSFKIWHEWRMSLFEMQFGTHISHIGRTVRLQIGVISVSGAI